MILLFECGKDIEGEEGIGVAFDGIISNKSDLSLHIVAIRLSFFLSHQYGTLTKVISLCLHNDSFCTSRFLNSSSEFVSL